MGGPLLGVHIIFFFICESFCPVARNNFSRKDSVRQLYCTPHMLRYSECVFRSINWPSSGT